MANNRPEDAVYTILDAALSVDVYKGPVTDGPNVADDGVFLIATGGPPPQSFFGQDPEQLRFKSVQVRVRSGKNKYNAGRTITQDAYQALQNAQPAGWLIIRMISSDAIYIGRDKEDRHEWSINVSCEIVE